MGQSYLIVNLDKKQFIKPHDFGDYPKLIEFGDSSGGTMFALAVLLSSGNGRGGGDLFGSKYRAAVKRYHKGRRKTCPEAPNYNDPIIGSWAGDRIVVAGEYMDLGLYLPEKYQDRNLYDHARKHWSNISADIKAVMIDAQVMAGEREATMSPDTVVGRDASGKLHWVNNPRMKVRK